MIFLKVIKLHLLDFSLKILIFEMSGRCGRICGRQPGRLHDLHVADLWPGLAAAAGHVAEQRLQRRHRGIESTDRCVERGQEGHLDHLINHQPAGSRRRSVPGFGVANILLTV